MCLRRKRVPGSPYCSDPSPIRATDRTQTAPRSCFDLAICLAAGIVVASAFARYTLQSPATRAFAAMLSGVAELSTLMRRRWLLGAVVTLLVGHWSPARTDASCGDYLHVAPNAATASSGNPISLHDWTGHQRPRCQGPGCRSNRQQPPTPTPTTTVRVPDSAFLVISADESELRFVPRMDEPTRAFLVPEGTCIYRPPRRTLFVG